MAKRYKRVHCKDGFSVSIQAHDGAYCCPRTDDAPSYTEVELGYPSHKDELIMRYAEEPSRPTDTVYGYVPSTEVYILLTKHGGIVNGEVPSGIPYYENTHPRRRK